MNVNYDYQLKKGKNANPVVYTEDFSKRVSFLPYYDYASEEQTISLLFPTKKSKLKTWGSTGTDEIHYITVNKGTPLHIDPSYKRYSHQLILYVKGFSTSGLNKEQTPLYTGLYHILDGHSPHKLDNGGNNDSKYFAVAIDSDNILKTEEVVLIFLDYLENNYFIKGFDYEQKNL